MSVDLRPRDFIETAEGLIFAVLDQRPEEGAKVNAHIEDRVGPIAADIGAVQAAEALKLVIGCGESLAGRLLLLDGMAMEWRSIAVPRDPGCPVCGSR